MSKSKMPQIGEGIFSIIYLVFGFIAAAVMLINGGDSRILFLYGVMTLILAGGDSFHLVPRIINAFSDSFPKYNYWAGIGLMVSSVTMTVFYLVLYKIWGLMSGRSAPFVVEILLFVFAIIRIALCFFPENKWTTGGNPRWGIIRNVPFVFVGIIMIVLFFSAGRIDMAIAIILSFGCYLPVVLFAKKNPKIGMLMIPKTMAYMWIICMGLALIGG